MKVFPRTSLAVPGKQKGVALIVVLMVVVIVTLLAFEMGSRLQLQMRRMANIKDANQAYWYAVGAEKFAQKSIKTLVDLSSDVIHLGQPWSQEFVYPLDGGGIQAQLTDMQACFNLNALSDPTGTNSPSGDRNPSTDLGGTDGGRRNDNNDNNRLNGGGGNNLGDGVNREEYIAKAFRSLLDNAQLTIEIPDLNADTFSDSLIDWIDDDDEIRDFGAEDSDYESLVNPYVAANNLLTVKSEARLINGVEVPWLRELMPLICVIPNEPGLKINVNTLTSDSAALLAALTGLEISDANSVIGNRPESGYSSVEDFLNVREVSALQLNDVKRSWFDTTTQYFILHTKTRYNKATFKMASLFRIDDGQVKVIRREFTGAL